MGARTNAKATRARALLNGARTNLISRTARVYSRLGRSLSKELNGVVQEWISAVLRESESDIASGLLSGLPAMPNDFERVARETMVRALAQGYWLQHVYMQECRAAAHGHKYRGRVTLADGAELNDEEIRRLLESLLKSARVEADPAWHSVIPVDAVKWIEGYTPKLAGVLERDILEKVRQTVRDSMLAGTTLKQRMEALREAEPRIRALGKHRAEMIARTEVTRADSMGRLIDMKSNPDVLGVEFSAVLDDRTTDICQSRHGLVMRMDDPRLPYNTPPMHVNCVLGDTLVSPVGRITAQSERIFDGDVFTIESSRGYSLTGTPNHPVLTWRGWVPLCKVQEGDYIVCDTLSERRNVVYGDHQQMPSRIKDIASALFNDGQVFSAPVPITAKDFHGDGRNNDIAIVRAYRKLTGRDDISFGEHVAESGFVTGRAFSVIEKSTKSPTFLFFLGALNAAHSIMCFLGQRLSFFWRCAFHAGKLLFMSISGLNPMLEENKADRGCRSEPKSFGDPGNPYTLVIQPDNSVMVNGIDGAFPLNTSVNKHLVDCIKVGMVFLAEFHNADPRKVVFDKVVGVERRGFWGHVYNLQTGSGTYFASNILTHNCRSLLLSATVYEHPDGLLTSHEFDEIEPGIQRPEDIDAVREVLGSNESVVRGTQPPAPIVVPRVELENPLPSGKTVEQSLTPPPESKIEDSSLPRLLPPDIGAELRDAFRDSPEFIQEAYKAYKDELQGLLRDKNAKGSRYSQRKRNIVLGQSEKHTTLPHEFGHFVDHCKGSGARGAMASSQGAFADAIKEGRNSFRGNGKAKAEKRVAMQTIMAGKMGQNPGVSDIFDGLSLGKIGGRYGHRAEYWKIPGKVEGETFANLFQLYAQNDREGIDCINALFPSIIKAFLKLLGEG